MRIAIIGCGWVGEKLAAHLSAKGHHIIATTPSVQKIPELKKVAAEAHILDFGSTVNFDFLDSTDVAIFSMPISSDGWHAGFERFSKSFPKTVLFSSTGIYPQENRTFTENDRENLRPDILASENVVRMKYPQTNILRFGGLMGGARSLQNLYNGRTPHNPQKLTNYIHYEDILDIVELVIRSEIKGEIYNIVAPEHPSIAEVLNIPVPPDAVPMERQVSSDHFIQDFHYTFKHPNPQYF